MMIDASKVLFFLYHESGMNLIYSSMLLLNVTKGKENRSPGQQRIGRTLSFNDLVKDTSN